LAGTPDHDDIIKVQYKVNEFIENINKKSIINSKLFKEIVSLSEDFKKVFITIFTIYYLLSPLQKLMFLIQQF